VVADVEEDRWSINPGSENATYPALSVTKRDGNGLSSTSDAVVGCAVHDLIPKKRSRSKSSVPGRMTRLPPAARGRDRHEEDGSPKG
jgi:hypothetical protein